MRCCKRRCWVGGGVRVVYHTYIKGPRTVGPVAGARRFAEMGFDIDDDDDDDVLVT